MVKTKIKALKSRNVELDSVYLFKMAIYLVLGSFWIRFSSSSQSWQVPVPVGLMAGIVLANRDRFQIDRKIEYAILLMAMFIGFWLPVGLVVTF